MSDEANEVFGASPDGNAGDRASGESDATELLEGDEGNVAPPTRVGEVDVSVFAPEFREFLSGLEPEQAEVIARENRRQYDEMKRNQTKKHQELAEQRKQVEQDAQFAAFGRQIAENQELMARVMGMNGAAGGDTEAPQPTTPLAEIDFSTPDGESELARAIVSNPAARKELENLIRQVAGETATSALSSDPIIQRQRLQAAASSVRSQYASDLKDDQWRVITDRWVESKGGAESALKVDPQTAHSELSMLAQIAQGMAPTNETRRPNATGAPSPSGTTSAPLKQQTPWEREGRKMTLQEIKDYAGGTKPGDLERAFKQGRAKGNPFF